MNKNIKNQKNIQQLTKSIILSGDRANGPLHLGHYVGSLTNRISAQNIHKQFIMIADIQALTDNFKNSKKIENNIIEIMLDYLSIGIDPQKNTIFIQSKIPELTELTMYYMNFVTINRLKRNPTIKSEIKQKKYNNNLSIGFLSYPISQAADITAFKANLVLVGQDQIPIIEQTNEIIKRFNKLYNTSYLKKIKPYLGIAPKLIGIDGKLKASKSLGNTIFLSDSEKSIKEKVFSMFTDPKHIKSSSPGKIEKNVVFTYLDIFDTNKEELNLLKMHYTQGGLGDIELKQRLNKILQELLAPFREKRKSINRKDIIEILMEGSNAARSFAKNTILEIKDIMGLKYF